MKNLILPVLGLLFLASCASHKAKVKTVVYNEKSQPALDKIIVMPVITFKGNQTLSSKSYDENVLDAWGDIYGDDRIIAGGQPLLDLAKQSPKTFYKFVNSIHRNEDIPDLAQSTWMKKLLKRVKSKHGNHPIGFAVANGGKKRFQDGKPVYLHLALFDQATMTWKYITKVMSPKGAGSWNQSTASMTKSARYHILNIIENDRYNRAPASAE